MPKQVLPVASSGRTWVPKSGQVRLWVDLKQSNPVYPWLLMYFTSIEMREMYERVCIGDCRQWNVKFGLDVIGVGTAGNGGARPHNAETAGAYFHPRNNLQSLPVGW